MELMQANTQWTTRPDDERYTNLYAMHDHFVAQRSSSREVVVSSRKLQVAPIDDSNNGLAITGPNGHAYAPTHHAFGQLATLCGAPAGYLRTLPAPMAADCLNYGLQVERDAQDIGVLLYRNGEAPTLRAATGPKYGRVWNEGITRALTKQFGNGLEGRFRVPGIFGEALQLVTKANTTMFAGDRDMFVFLADEQNRIELPNRRDGKTGTLARGFFVWNSEVGARTFGVKTFLFDYVCSNRIVWGARDVQGITIRHTASAPDKFIEQVQPAMLAYANSSAHAFTDAISNARKARLDNVDTFLAQRFGPRMVATLKAAHMTDEARPIETAWDAVTAATAHARTIAWQDERVALETEAGKILDAVAA